MFIYPPETSRPKPTKKTMSDHQDMDELIEELRATQNDIYLLEVRTDRIEQAVEDVRDLVTEILARVTQYVGFNQEAVQVNEPDSDSDAEDVVLVLSRTD